MSPEPLVLIAESVTTSTVTVMWLCVRKFAPGLVLTSSVGTPLRSTTLVSISGSRLSSARTSTASVEPWRRTMSNELREAMARKLPTARDSLCSLPEPETMPPLPCCDHDEE